MPRLLVILLVALTGCGDAERSSNQIRVAMASDLALAFDEIGKTFRARTGVTVIFSPGSTGLLARQLEEGAPFDLFAAANVDFVDRVVAAGVCDGATKAHYARGRIVLWSRGEAPARLEDLSDPRWARISIANPDHAPYGRAAMQALERAGVRDAVAGKLVRGENILSAMQYAKAGEVDVGIVALSLAVVADGGSSTPIDPSMHDPLDQALVVCGNGPGKPAAIRFAAFLASPEGREIMNRYGFQLPGEATPPAPTGGTGGGGGHGRTD
jgi:molybdate transport system substrate-binding protein